MFSKRLFWNFVNYFLLIEWQSLGDIHMAASYFVYASFCVRFVSLDRIMLFPPRNVKKMIKILSKYLYFVFLLKLNMWVFALNYTPTVYLHSKKRQWDRFDIIWTLNVAPLS